MDKIKLSVRELVEFIYKSGDINTKGFSSSRAMEGIKAHKILQSEMSELGVNYQKEYYLKHEFAYNEIFFTLEGRADGILIENNSVIIDEIKSTYRNLDEINEDYNITHLSQAKCYAYIYSLQNSIKNIKVQLRYFNIDTKDTKKIIYKLNFDELEIFFYELIDKYIDWAKTIINLNKLRRDSIKELKFPFESYRKGQREFSVAVFRTIKEGKKLFAQAPTGVGKTVSVLFPAIKSMNYKENSKIFYLTAKSSTKTIAFNTVKMMIEKGLDIRSTVITAKEKMCFKEECNCDPEYCQFSRGYYDKVNNILLDIIKNNQLYDREYIENIAKENEICPFELTLDLSYISDIVICDYNYYFDPRVSLQRDDTLKNNNDILLIDEAHNLEDRARNMYSPELVKEEFWEAYKIIKNTEKKISKSLNNINKKFIEIKKESEETTSITKEPSDLIKSLRKLVNEAEEFIKDPKKEVPKEFLDVYFKSIFFIKISEIADENFCYYTDFSNKKTLIKIFLIDPSKILAEIEKNSSAIIFFSATLTPLKYYRYLLGGDDNDYLMKIKSPFEEENLKILITGDISMKYSLRDLNILKVCEYINISIKVKKGNYMVFFPSYSYLEKVYEVYQEKYENDNIIVHNQSFKEEDQVRTIDKFMNENNVVLFTVVGGVFSEGVDLPLEKLIGAVIIGTGIPQISFERDIIKDFFDKKYNSGFDFAYKFPGWNKILQSAGRVIRTENDEGIILLIDSRVGQSSYINLFPDHWRHYKKIYNMDSLKDEINNFWS